MLKRILCLFLCLSLAVGILPLGAAAAQEESGIPFEEPDISGLMKPWENWPGMFQYDWASITDGDTEFYTNFYNQSTFVFSFDSPQVLTGLQIWTKKWPITEGQIFIEAYTPEGEPPVERGNWGPSRFWKTICSSTPTGSEAPSVSFFPIHALGKHRYYRLRITGSCSISEFKLYGKSEFADPVTVTLDADASQGGQGTIPVYTMERNTLFTLPDCTFTNSQEDKFQSGWEIGGQNYAAGTELTLSDSIVARAVWDSLGTVSLTSDLLRWENTNVNVSGTLTLPARADVVGRVILNLEEGCTLNAPYGIHVGPMAELTIRGTGALNALNRPRDAMDSYMPEAAIGGNGEESCGIIIIDGGRIRAESISDDGFLSSGAAIGGGDVGPLYSDSYGGTITINGGHVQAQTDYYTDATAIGAGAGGFGFRITFNGGTVEATGNKLSAIGQYSSHVLHGDRIGTIAFNGGKITAISDIFIDPQPGIRGNIYGEAPGNATVVTNAIEQKRGVDRSRWRGIFSEDEGSSYVVYGDVTLSENLTIPRGKTLIIPSQGSSLTWTEPVTVTNNGTIIGTPNGIVAGTAPVPGATVTLEPGWDSTDTYIGPQASVHLTQAVGSAFVLPRPEFFGPDEVDLAGWVTAGDPTLYQPGQSITLEHDMVFTARWNVTCFLNFDSNGGQGTMEPVECIGGKVDMLPLCTMTPPQGKAFIGWELNGITYPANDNTLGLSIDADTTVKALWGNEPELDGETYLLGSAADMADYARIVNGVNGPTRDARITADITLDDSFPVIHSLCNNLYGGGHTITLHYENPDESRKGGLTESLSGDVSDLTIDGYVKNASYFGGLCNTIAGHISISRCQVSLQITGVRYYEVDSIQPDPGRVIGGFISEMPYFYNVGFYDCLFNGTIRLAYWKAPQQICSGCFVGRGATRCNFQSCYVSGSIENRDAQGLDITPQSQVGIFEGNFINEAPDASNKWNCVYLDTINVSTNYKFNVSERCTPKTAAQFANGDACYELLRGSAKWRQTINAEPRDPFPVLDSTHNTVLKSGEFYYNPILSDAAFSGLLESYEYTGSQICPRPAVSTALLPQGLAPEAEQDFFYSYGKNRDVTDTGNVSIELSERSRFDFEPLSATFVITPKEVHPVIEEIPAPVYTGSQLKPQIVVTCSDTCLDEMLRDGTDYIVTYGENTEIATGGTVTIEPVKGSNYVFAPVTKSFAIQPMPQAPLFVTGIPRDSNDLEYGDSFTLSTRGGDGKGEISWRIIRGAENASVDARGKITVLGVGSFTVQAVKAAQGNYAAAEATAELVSIPREVSLRWENTALTYNGKVQTPTAVAGNLIGEDSCTVTVTGGKIHVGEGYTAAASGLDNPCYRLPQENTVSFSIAPRPIAGAQVRLGDALIYNGELQTQPVASAEVGGLPIDFTVSENTGRDADTYTLTLTARGDFTGAVQVPFSIAPCPKTVIPAPGQEKTYGQEDPAFTWEADLFGSDTLTGSLSREAGENAGSYPFTLGTLQNPNYTLSLEAADFTIAPKEALLSATVAGKPYDGTTDAEITSWELQGILPGDAVSLLQGKAVFVSPEEGESVPVELQGFALTGEDAKNYQLILSDAITGAITHNWGPWEVVKAPTVTEEGLKQRTCKGCGATETKILPRLFRDVDPEEYYAEPISWAVLHEITQGVSDTRFGPNKGCLREHAVTFLWRAAGEPEPTLTDPGFVDVSQDAYYYKAVCWAVENGIVMGMDKTHFGPSRVCAREHVVTFLWRAAGKPRAETQTGFTDVKDGAYYREAVSWAVEQHITAGITSTRFGPTRPCTRGQIVTFLYRYFEPLT